MFSDNIIDQAKIMSLALFTAAPFLFNLFFLSYLIPLLKYNF